METYRSIRDQMRETSCAITAPTDPHAARPTIARLSRGGGEADDDSAVEPWMVEAFARLARASETGEDFDLVECRMNGDPAVIIAATRQKGRSTFVMPLFMAVQPWMKFTSPAPGAEADADDG